MERWRWPLRLAVAAVVVNVIGVNVEWLRLRKEADGVRQSMVQIFKSAYPKEPLVAAPLDQMRRNIRLAMADSGQTSADEFTTLSAAFGEALGVLPRKDVIATLEYKDRALLVKVKPNMVDAAAMSQLRAALAGRKLDLTEPNPGAWQIRAAAAAGGKS
ncbi:type II secretion system protein GspL [Duganella callida]|uniref:GspL periplasmic domain-containing protein n=1 Tax=Duganella callida TaxID=2561932 RepID=A0A4Y9RZD3_9BURK|nr:type II secretion system protein GspL [Duganella callida]TFW13581.1 hypothetical protein E4L98_28910 [Duganella callida]